MSNTAIRKYFEVDSEGVVEFERLAKSNGTRYWFARDLMTALGYDNWSAFRKVVNKAIGVCTSVGIIIAENFIQCKRGRLDDFKLSRLACFLIAMNGDSKKPTVAVAQAYFASLAAIVASVGLDQESLDRIVIRDEISEQERALSGAAKAAGVVFYSKFQDAGYRGMYNMDYAALKSLKNIPDMKRSLLDFMGKDELAGNLFRLSLTEGRIRRDNVRGQEDLESVAEEVGRRVRNTMIDETGVRPEDLPIGPDIKKVRGGLKDAHRGFSGTMDNLARQRADEAEHRAGVERLIGEVVPGCEECALGNRYSHFGSPQCSSGSIASGGDLSHCECDYCSAIL